MGNLKRDFKIISERTTSDYNRLSWNSRVTNKDGATEVQNKLNFITYSKLKYPFHQFLTAGGALEEFACTV